MMREVITRRFRRYLDEQAKPIEQRKFSYPPNLVIIDGGKGQLNAARAALDELGISGVEICGLAKRLEEVFLPDRAEPVLLPRASEALYLLQRVRDEAHRFAITYHRTLRGRQMVESAFDEIPGIGPSRRRSLLDMFGSLQGVREATVDDLAQTPGISDTLARTIHAHFHADTLGRAARKG
jgi:excinuclease ABC subunit C